MYQGKTNIELLHSLKAMAATGWFPIATPQVIQTQKAVNEMICS